MLAPPSPRTFLSFILLASPENSGHHPPGESTRQPRGALSLPHGTTLISHVSTDLSYSAVPPAPHSRLSALTHGNTATLPVHGGEWALSLSEQQS